MPETAVLGLWLAAAPVLVLAAGVVVLRRRFLIVTVQGRSMAPSLLPGDRVLVARRAGALARRGDIVAVRPDGASWYLKRVAARPGEPLPAGVPAPDGGRVVPAGTLALLGDGPHSLDSRQWGCVPTEHVSGVVVRRLPRPSGRKAE